MGFNITYRDVKVAIPEVAKVNKYIVSFQGGLGEPLNIIKKMYAPIKTLSYSQKELNQTTISVGNGFQINIPTNKKPITSINMTFIDNENREIRNAFKSWINMFHFNKAISISKLKSKSADVLIQTLDTTGTKVVQEDIFSVIPNKLDILLDSNSLQSDEIPMDFIVIGHK